MKDFNTCAYVTPGKNSVKFMEYSVCNSKQLCAISVQYEMKGNACNQLVMRAISCTPRLIPWSLLLKWHIEEAMLFEEGESFQSCVGGGMFRSWIPQKFFLHSSSEFGASLLYAHQRSYPRFRFSKFILQMIERCFRPSLILLHSVHNNATAFLPVPIKIARMFQQSRLQFMLLAFSNVHPSLIFKKPTQESISITLHH